MKLRVQDEMRCRLVSACMKGGRLDEHLLQDMTLGLFLLGFTGLVPMRPETTQLKNMGGFGYLDLSLSEGLTANLKKKAGVRQAARAAEACFDAGYYSLFPEDFSERGGA